MEDIGVEECCSRNSVSTFKIDFITSCLIFSCKVKEGVLYFHMDWQKESSSPSCFFTLFLFSINVIIFSRSPLLFKLFLYVLKFFSLFCLSLSILFNNSEFLVLPVHVPVSVVVPQFEFLNASFSGLSHYNHHR